MFKSLSLFYYSCTHDDACLGHMFNEKQQSCGLIHRSASQDVDPPDGASLYIRGINNKFKKMSQKGNEL